MNTVKLRLYTYKPDGTEKKTDWSFVPANYRPALVYDRESDTAVTGRLCRRPYSEQLAREITLGAGLLLSDFHWLNFLRLLRSHKIEMEMLVGGKPGWVEFDLDVEGKIDFEFIEESDRHKKRKVRLVQSDPLYYTDFENAEKHIADPA